MVRASGLSTRRTLSGESPRRLPCSITRVRTNSSNCDFKLRCVSHSSASSTRSMPSQVRGSPLCSCQPAPKCRSYRRNICGASQVGTCTPFVMCEMGTASSDLPGYSPVHMARDTSPCRAETALARRQSFRHSTVMQNSSHGLPGFSRPSSMSRSGDRPSNSQRGPRCSSINPALNRSCPAGTGVWVVKTTSRETRRAASSKRRPSSCIRFRIASSAANPLCPSFRCRTPGVMPIALSARKPPTPSNSSWRIRIRLSPPYRREVSSRSSGAFPGTLESRRSRSQRPTFMRQTLARIGPLWVSTSTMTGSPLAPIAGSMGSSLTSVARYSSCCQPF